MYVVEQVMLVLYGRLDQEQVKPALAAGGLEVKFVRVNARGLLRATGTGTRL